MTDLMFTHASSNTFMPLKDLQEDVERLLTAPQRLWVTLTECSEPESVEAVRAVAQAHGYRGLKPDDGDIMFLVSKELPVKSTGGATVVPAKRGPAAKGGHGPRCNSWFRTEYDGEDITHTGIHTVTAHPTKHITRRDQQMKQVGAMAQQLAKFGKGARLATGSGDLNASLPREASIQAIFDKYGLTTTAEETGVTTPTHGDARLDYVWTRDQDHRLVVKSMVVRRGPVFHSDHDPIDVWVHVRGRG